MNLVAQNLIWSALSSYYPLSLSLVASKKAPPFLSLLGFGGGQYSEARGMARFLQGEAQNG